MKFADTDARLREILMDWLHNPDPPASGLSEDDTRSLRALALGTIRGLEADVARLKGEIEGTDQLAADPEKWGLRARLDGVTEHRDAKEEEIAGLVARMKDEENCGDPAAPTCSAYTRNHRICRAHSARDHSRLVEEVAKLARALRAAVMAPVECPVTVGASNIGWPVFDADGERAFIRETEAEARNVAEALNAVADHLKT